MIPKKPDASPHSEQEVLIDPIAALVESDPGEGFTEEATQPLQALDLELDEGVLSEGFLDESTDQLGLDELGAEHIKELTGDPTAGGGAASDLPHILPWRFTGVLIDERREVPVRLAPERELSAWRGGGNGALVEVRLGLEDWQVLVSLHTEAAAEEEILLGRDVLGGKVLISC
ncbi:MAG: hypothetical protein JXX28_17860 [Deltaproteobacteria bacterium]|nr:hypothetical protein [Deltaproteobacteria bacterium]